MNPQAAETDIVVIGSGVSGLAAALTAAERGARAIVFEKHRSIGGSSNFFQGIFAVESEMQRKRYITYSRDEAFKNIMEYSHWRANPRLVRAFVDASANTISWLQKQGVEFIDVSINMPGAPRTYHVVKGNGEAVVKILATKAKGQGAELKLASPVKRILKHKEKITGVLAESEGEDIHIASKAVIIASGGYANNKEWIKKYSGFDLGVNLIPVGNIDKMGDGIRMAWEAGAAEEGLGILELFRVGPVGPDFAMRGQIELAASQPDLWIDRTGQRFCDESISFNDTSVGNANARYKEGYTYSVFDDSIIQRLLDRGIDRNVAWEFLPGSRPLDLDLEIRTAIERGTQEIFAAESVEELAEKISINPSVLKATIDEYNEFCEKGHDDLFAKDRRYLWALKGPRFYAVKARTIFLGTLGGIKINHKMEVLNKNENIVPGLYAVGFDAGGMYGDSYCIRDSSGGSAGFAVNSGRIAGENAAKYIAGAYEKS